MLCTCVVGQYLVNLLLAGSCIASLMAVGIEGHASRVCWHRCQSWSHHGRGLRHLDCMLTHALCHMLCSSSPLCAPHMASGTTLTAFCCPVRSCALCTCRLHGHVTRVGSCSYKLVGVKHLHLMPANRHATLCAARHTCENWCVGSCHGVAVSTTAVLLQQLAFAMSFSVALHFFACVQPHAANGVVSPQHTLCWPHFCVVPSHVVTFDSFR
ncbi:hypothetical protein COO60DRAFT_463418 [Scenedesmus sp. NREL 46B-D3]|nr:hypothetical protein COO60DRAFT_463418 [Scenedesmus sp. NREL 46B-D3]